MKGEKGLKDVVGQKRARGRGRWFGETQTWGRREELGIERFGGDSPYSDLGGAGEKKERGAVDLLWAHWGSGGGEP